MGATNYLRHYVDWANERPDFHQVLFSMVTNQGPSGPCPQQRPAVASYAEGRLSSDGRGGISGRVAVYLSDRRVAGGLLPAPFDPARAESLGVEIALDAGTGTIVLVACPPGARGTLVDLRQEDEVLVGTGPTVGDHTEMAVYVVSLGKTVRTD